jgi:hypothetical protein
MCKGIGKLGILDVAQVVLPATQWFHAVNRAAGNEEFVKKLLGDTSDPK